MELKRLVYAKGLNLLFKSFDTKKPTEAEEGLFVKYTAIGLETPRYRYDVVRKLVLYLSDIASYQNIRFPKSTFNRLELLLGDDHIRTQLKADLGDVEIERAMMNLQVSDTSSVAKGVPPARAGRW